MSLAAYFDDPRHRACEALMFEAEAVARRGEDAQELWERAASEEEAVARALPREEGRGKSIFGVSAVTLRLRARQWEQAKALALWLLAESDGLTEGARAELEGLFARAQREAMLEATLASLQGAEVLEAVLEGGRIGHGLAPSGLVADLRDILQSVVVRCGEARAKLPFRKKGRSKLHQEFVFLDAQPIAGSYGVRWVVTDVSSHAGSPLIANGIRQEAVALLLELATGRQE
ncbi:MAG: hypothetical protein JNJ59_24025, partial [Deltaproteobacteria bacterium]|nr:hypothetical protein [Deltaproteobacteria bacterium]